MAPVLQPDSAGIQSAADTVRNGGIIVYPTETVYGIGADPFNARALDRVYSLKVRAAEKSFILLIRGLQDLNSLVSEIPPEAQSLIQAFWPGPLTLIFKARSDLPPRLTGGRDTIAVRVSDAAIPRNLLDLFGGPITSTSANRAGKPPVLSANEAAREFQSDIDLILDGGSAAEILPSTLLNVSTNPISLLREGRILASELRQVIDF